MRAQFNYWWYEDHELFFFRPALAREKSTVARGSNGPGKAAGGGKRPAWDLKGRLEDMEKMFDQTSRRIGDLEKEKEGVERSEV